MVNQTYKQRLVLRGRCFTPSEFGFFNEFTNLVCFSDWTRIASLDITHAFGDFISSRAWWISKFTLLNYTLRESNSWTFRELPLILMFFFPIWNGFVLRSRNEFPIFYVRINKVWKFISCEFRCTRPLCCYVSVRQLIVLYTEDWFVSGLSHISFYNVLNWDSCSINEIYWLV